MTRRLEDKERGIRAYWDGICPRCGLDIIRGESRVFAKRGEWIHIECQSGADE